MKFRYDINALRAIAVLSVLFFHLKIPLFSGGFSGVDIFYVISGYLMTRIIISDLDKNKFSIWNFYSKRIQRIIPALLFLILIMLAVGFFLYLPNEYQENAKNATSSLLFYSNFLYWKNSLGYFNQSSETNLFLHTWSLSVEWQFYMIYPIFILLMYRIFKKKRPFIAAFVIITILSCCFSILFTYESPSASFFLFISRSWEMMIGGLAFLFENKFSSPKKWLAVSGYFILGGLSIVLSNQMLWPGIFTLPLVLVTACIIIFNVSQIAFIKNGVVQFLGRISYSLYLWHWPLIVLTAYLGIQLHFFPIVLIIILSVVLAYISFTFIESIKLKSLLPVFSALILVLITSILLGRYDVNKIMFKRETIAIANYEATHGTEINQQMSNGSCFCVIPEENKTGWKNYFNSSCLRIDSTKENFLLMGDSHAAVLSESLKDSLKHLNINLLQCTAAGSLPVLGQFEKNTLFDYLFNDFIVTNKTKINGIIMTGWWDHPKNHDYDLLIKNLDKTIAYIKSLDIPVLIIGANETYIIPFPDIAARDFQFNRNSSALYLAKNTQEVNNLIKDRFREYYIDIINTCTEEIGPGHVPYMYDEDHFTKYGADIVIRKIFDTPQGSLFLKN